MMKNKISETKSDDNLIGRAVDFVETTDLIKPFPDFYWEYSSG
ncbi:MAG: hypothetical protein CM1200mP10_17940 [Candidatus Neomarinimicrobiota bacterium]|nr:MAG: hypothetical protein CM1200mP10_17940 [Candidatus Neomarinimicrobiota bacterium]